MFVLLFEVVFLIYKVLKQFGGKIIWIYNFRNKKNYLFTLEDETSYMRKQVGIISNYYG